MRHGLVDKNRKEKEQMLTKICATCGRKILQRESCSCRHQSYDKIQRNKSRETFYHSKLWRSISDYAKTRANGIDEYLLFYEGKICKGNTTHHIHTVEERPDLKLTVDNLVYVSSATHNMIHNEYDKSAEAKRKMQQILEEIRKRN